MVQRGCYKRFRDAHLPTSASCPASLLVRQARKAQEAEEEAERARLAEAEARRVAAQVQAVQNRQLRDSLAWLRNSAKWPKESLPRCACAPCFCTHDSGSNVLIAC
jgi:hypothetical protein